MENNILIIVGSVVSILLTINGFFIRELVKSLYDVRLRVEVLISKHDNTEKTADKNASDIANIMERLVKVEGFALQFKQFIQDYKDDNK